MRRWGLHVGVYLLALLALLAVTDRDDSWNLDDGAYATQVAVWRDTGTWAYPYRHAAQDPEFRFAPVSHPTNTVDGTYPYVKFPAWIVVLRASTGLFGPVVGLHLPSVVGAVLAALAAGLLADALARRRGLPGPVGALGFWAVALGPVVVHTSALWAHTAAAALGGFAVLLVVGLAEGRERRWHPFALLALAAALCLVRGEGPLFVVALAVTAAAVAWLRPDRGDRTERLRTAAVWGLLPLVAAGGARLVNRWWVHRIATGDPVATFDPEILAGTGFVAGQARGATRTLIDGLGTTQAATLLGVLVAVAALAAGVVLARSRGTDRAGVWIGLGLLTGAVALVVQRARCYPTDLGGLVVAVPVAVAGLAAWRWRPAPTGERALVGTVGLFVAAVLVTQYPEGGSVDWGGRFLFPALVPLTVVGAVAVWSVLATAWPPLERSVALRLLAGLLVLVAIPTACGLYSTAQTRDAIRASTERARRADAPTVIRMPRFAARTSWRLLPEADWLSAEPDEAADALAMLRPGRRDPVAVVGAGADQVEADGWRARVVSPTVVIFTPTS